MTSGSALSRAIRAGRTPSTSAAGGPTAASAEMAKLRLFLQRFLVDADRDTFIHAIENPRIRVGCNLKNYLIGQELFQRDIGGVGAAERHTHSPTKQMALMRRQFKKMRESFLRHGNDVNLSFVAHGNSPTTTHKTKAAWPTKIDQAV